MSKRKLIAIVLAVFMVIFAASCKNEASEPTVDDNVYVAPEGYLGAWVMGVDSFEWQINLNDDGTCTLMSASFKEDGSLADAGVSDEGTYKVYEGTGVNDKGDNSGLADFSIICTDLDLTITTTTTATIYFNLFYDNATGSMYVSSSENEINPPVNYTDEVFGDVPTFSEEVKRPEYLLELADDQSDIRGVWMSSKTDNYIEYIFENGKITYNNITLTSATTEERGKYKSYVNEDGYGYFVVEYVENKVTKSSKVDYQVYEYAGEKYLSSDKIGFMKKIEKSNYDETKKKIGDITGAYTCTKYTSYTKAEDDWSTTKETTPGNNAGKLYLGIENDYRQDKKGEEPSVSFDGRSLLIEDADGTYALSEEKNLTPAEVSSITGTTYADEAAVKKVYSAYKKGKITFTPEKGFAKTWTYTLLVKETDNSKVLVLTYEEGNTKTTVEFATPKG